MSKHVLSSQVGEVWDCFEVMGQAVLLTDLAVIALPAVTADALVHADFVDAGASIAAWVALAVIDVYEKQKSREDVRLGFFFDVS